MFKLALWVVILFPFVGLILINLYPIEYDWLTLGKNEYTPLLYYALFLLGAVTAAFRFNDSRSQIISQFHGPFRSEFPLLVFLLVIVVVVLVGYDGLNVLLGSASKEDIRLSGFIYSIFTKYLVPSIFAYVSILRRIRLLSFGSWVLALLMTILVGLSLGGKASVLIVILPGLAILLDGRLSFFKVLAISIAFLISLMATAWMFDSFLEGDIADIASYLLKRAFVLTAEAPFHVSIAYSESQPIIEYHYTLFEVFGKSLLSNFVDPNEIHKYIFSHAITAMLYPSNIDSIVSGVWNITPNVFVEALVVGGVFLLPLAGWLVVYTAYALWTNVMRKVKQGKFASAAITSVFSIMVYLSWTNSAGIMQLIHPLAIGSLTLSWLCLKILSQNSFRQLANLKLKNA